MTQNLTTAFSVGDTAYFPLFATASIYAVQVTDVYLRTVDGNSVIYYDLLRLDKNLVLEGIPEAQMYTFPNAKIALMTYLQNALTAASKLTAP